MSSKQRIKILILYIARFVGLFRLGRFLTRRGLTIIGWHGVSLSDEHERFTSLFISPESFRRRLTFIKKCYEVIDLDTAIKQHESGKFKKRQIVLTFDDGFYNFFKVAAPILEEYNMTATNYVVSEPMLNQLPILILLVQEVILTCALERGEISIDGLEGTFDLSKPKERKRLINSALAKYRSMLDRDYETRFQFVKELAIALKVDIDPVIKKRVLHSMNKDEIRIIAEKGFSMQNHTDNHFNVIDYADEVYQEVKECKSKLEAVTGKEADHFCYPSGLWQKEAWRDLSRLNMRSAVTTMQGPNFSRTPVLGLRRVLNGEDRNQLQFEFELSNLSWLVYVICHPSKLFEASEKRVKLTKDKKFY